MESKTHYVIVGLFVLILAAGAVFFALWMGELDEKRHAFRLYETYMFESVSGLPKDGAVKYMGVEIGKVASIDVDSKHPNRVRLRLKLPSTFVVTEGMYTQLKLEGITGIAYVEISGGRSGAKPIPIPKERLPIIPSRPSALSKLGDTIPEATLNLSNAFKRLTDALDADTIEHLHHTLAHLDEVSHRLERFLSEKNAQNIEITLTNLAQASRHLRSFHEAADALKTTAHSFNIEGNRTMQAIIQSAHSVETAAESLTHRLQKGEFDLRAMLAQTIDETNRLLAQTQRLILQLQEGVEHLDRSPADLLYKRSSPMLGPGEKK